MGWVPTRVWPNDKNKLLSKQLKGQIQSSPRENVFSESLLSFIVALGKMDEYASSMTERKDVNVHRWLP